MEFPGLKIGDEGGGITRRSLEYFERYKPKLGKIKQVEVCKEEVYHIHDVPYTMVITGAGCRMFLSGCNCGYGGEGPHGSLKILRSLGMDSMDFEQSLIDRRVFTYDVEKQIAFRPNVSEMMELSRFVLWKRGLPPYSMPLCEADHSDDDEYAFKLFGFHMGTLQAFTWLDEFEKRHRELNGMLSGAQITLLQP